MKRADLIAQLRSNIASIESGAAPSAFSDDHDCEEDILSLPDRLQGQGDGIRPTAHREESQSCAPARPRQCDSSRLVESGTGASPETSAPPCEGRVAVAHAGEHVDSISVGEEADGTEERRAFLKLVELVNASDRSEKALRERLARIGYSADAIESALDRARGCGYVDDARFGELLIRSRLSQRKGAAGIERELKANGIDPYSIEGWPEAFEVDHESELDRALALLDAKPPRSKNKREGAFRKLVQRGFSTGVSASAARIWSER